VTVSNAHILVVDDDDRIRELLKAFLARRGFRVSTAPDAETAWRLVTSVAFDLCVFDVMMPGEDGFGLATRLRAVETTPIILLTARGLAEDRIKGFTIGVDDYVAKPFEPEELALRIEAILRRSAARRAEAQLPVTFGTHHFDPARGELKTDNLVVRLTEAEVHLLRVLAESAGQSVAREDLARNGDDVAERTVDVQIMRLRQKLGDDPRAPRWLQTVRGIGYRLMVD
jgi:two-component system, OmpR family, phosphate regulon response regulator OmpR